MKRMALILALLATQAQAAVVASWQAGFVRTEVNLIHRDANGARGALIDTCTVGEACAGGYKSRTLVIQVDCQAKLVHARYVTAYDHQGQVVVSRGINETRQAPADDYVLVAACGQQQEAKVAQTPVRVKPAADQLVHTDTSGSQHWVSDVKKPGGPVEFTATFVCAENVTCVKDQPGLRQVRLTQQADCATGDIRTRVSNGWGAWSTPKDGSVNQKKVIAVCQ